MDVVNIKSCGKVSGDIVVSLTAHLLFIILPPLTTEEKKKLFLFLHSLPTRTLNEVTSNKWDSKKRRCMVR